MYNIPLSSEDEVPLEGSFLFVGEHLLTKLVPFKQSPSRPMLVLTF